MSKSKKVLRAERDEWAGIAHARLQQIHALERALNRNRIRQTLRIHD